MLTNKGFAVIKSSTNIITSVSLGLSGDTVNITCSESPIGALVQYGITPTDITVTKLNLGNLKDSQGDLEKFTILGVEHNMDNWCPVFEYQL